LTELARGSAAARSVH